MLVRTGNIPEQGLDLDFSVSVKTLRAEIGSRDDLAEAFEQSVECHVHLQRMKKDFFLDGNAETSIHPTCARCNDRFSTAWPVHLTLTLAAEPRWGIPGADSYQESDEGVVYYRNNEIDLAEIIREQVLLSLPMKFLCQESCRGLCPTCGANLNRGAHACKKSVLEEKGA